MVLQIKKSDLTSIMKHAKEAYPHEACGILVGTIKAKDKLVKKIFRTRNVLNSAWKYQVDPEEQFRIFEEAERDGLKVIGFYHSHPSEDSYWSQIDEEHSVFWSGLSFLIVSVKFNRARCYVRNGEVEEEELVITD